MREHSVDFACIFEKEKLLNAVLNINQKVVGASGCAS